MYEAMKGGPECVALLSLNVLNADFEQGGSTAWRFLK
jgi:hypothetical protein